MRYHWIALGVCAIVLSACGAKLSVCDNDHYPGIPSCAAPAPAPTATPTPVPSATTGIAIEFIGTISGGTWTELAGTWFGEQALPLATAVPTSTPVPGTVYTGSYTLASGHAGPIYLVAANGSLAGEDTGISNDRISGLYAIVTDAALGSGTATVGALVLGALPATATLRLSTGDSGTVTLTATAPP